MRVTTCSVVFGACTSVVECAVLSEGVEYGVCISVVECAVLSAG